MDAEGELDLTSEPPAPIKPGNAPQPSDRKQRIKPNQPMRVFFHCCRVYALVNIPEGVQTGRLSSWRFHCPRCGQLTEIPL